MFDRGLAHSTNRRSRRTRGFIALVFIAVTHQHLCEACSVYELTGTLEYSHRQQQLGP